MLSDNYPHKTLAVKVEHQVVFAFPFFGEDAEISIYQLEGGLGTTMVDILVKDATLDFGGTVLSFSVALTASIPNALLATSVNQAPTSPQFLPPSAIHKLMVAKGSLRIKEHEGAPIRSLVTEEEIGEWYGQVTKFLHESKGLLVRIHSLT